MCIVHLIRLKVKVLQRIQMNLATGAAATVAGLGVAAAQITPLTTSEKYQC